MYDAPPQSKRNTYLFQKFLRKLAWNNQVELKQRPYLIKKRCNRNIYHACQNILGGQLSQILKWKTILFHIGFKCLSKVHGKELNMNGHWEEGWTSPIIKRFPEGKVWGKSRGRRGCSIHPCLCHSSVPSNKFSYRVCLLKIILIQTREVNLPDNYQSCRE